MRQLKYTYKDGGNSFKRHKMFDPNNPSNYVMAETYDDHVRLGQMGYIHEDELKKQMGGITDALTKNFNTQFFGTSPSTAKMNEQNPGLSNLNNFVNSVALRTQQSLANNAMNDNPEMFFMGGANMYNPGNFGYSGAANFNAFNAANTANIKNQEEAFANMMGLGNSFRQGAIQSITDPQYTTKVKTRAKGLGNKLKFAADKLLDLPKGIYNKGKDALGSIGDVFNPNAGVDFQAMSIDAMNKDTNFDQTQYGDQGKALEAFLSGKSPAEIQQMFSGAFNNRFGGTPNSLPQFDPGGPFGSKPNLAQSIGIAPNGIGGPFQFVDPTTRVNQALAGIGVGTNASTASQIGSIITGLDGRPIYIPPAKNYMQGFGIGNSIGSGLDFSGQQGKVQRVGSSGKASTKVEDAEVEEADDLTVDPNMPGVTTMDDIRDKGVKVEVDEDGKERIVVNEDTEGTEGGGRGNVKNPVIKVDETTDGQEGSNVYMPFQTFELNPRLFGNSSVDGVARGFNPMKMAYNPELTGLTKAKFKSNIFGNKAKFKFDHGAGEAVSNQRTPIFRRNKNRDEVPTEQDAESEYYYDFDGNLPSDGTTPSPEEVEVVTDAGSGPTRRTSFNAEPYVVGDEMSTSSPTYIGSVNPAYAQVDEYNNPTLQNPMQGVPVQEEVPFNIAQLQNPTMMDVGYTNQFGGTPLSNNTDMNYNYDYFNRGGVPSRRDNREFAREMIPGRGKYNRQDRRRLRRDLNRGIETQEGYMMSPEFDQPQPVPQAPIVREDNSFQQNISPMPLIDPGMVTMPEGPEMRTELANAGVTDDMSFSEAFATANRALGEDGTFMWRGKKYGTRRDPNWRGKKKEEEPKIVEAPIREEGQLDFDKGIKQEQDAAKAKVRETVKKKQKAKGSMELEFVQDAKRRGHIPYDARIGYRQDGTAYVNIDGQNRSIKSNDGKTWMLTPEGTNAPIYQKTYKNAQRDVNDYNADVQKVAEESLKLSPGSISYEVPDDSVAQNDQLTNLMYDIDVRDDSEAAPIQNRIRTIKNELMNAGVIDGFMNNDIKNRLESLIERFPAATSNEIAMFLKSGLNVPKKPVFEMMNSMGPDGKLRMSEDEVREMMLKKYFQQRLGGAQYGYGGGNMYGEGISGYYGQGGAKGEAAYLARRDAAIKASMANQQAAYGMSTGVNYFPQPVRRTVRRYQPGGQTGLVSIHQNELAKLQEMAQVGQQAMMNNQMYNAMTQGRNPMQQARFGLEAGDFESTMTVKQDNTAMKNFLRNPDTRLGMAKFATNMFNMDDEVDMGNVLSADNVFNTLPGIAGDNQMNQALGYVGEATPVQNTGNIYSANIQGAFT